MILYNIFCPLQVDKFSEADYVINIWALLFKHTFYKTPLWPHWGDTVPDHIKEMAPVYLKLDFCLIGNAIDCATGEAGVQVVNWKYFNDKTKLIYNALCPQLSIRGTTWSCFS